MSRDVRTCIRNSQACNKEQRLRALTNAGYIYIDSNDQIFVLNFGSNKVIPLETNLRWKQILNSNEGIHAEKL